MEELIKLYDKKYVNTFLATQHKGRLARLISYIKLDSTYSVVDIGCGNGMLMELIHNKVKDYIGVDFAEEFIKSANSKKEELLISNVKFICSNIKEFCSENKNKFDIAFALDFSEHVYDKEWISILRSIRYSLNHSGRLYLHTPNAHFLIEIMKKNNFLISQFPEHVAVRDIQHNCRLLNEAGFQIIKLKLLPHYNYLKYLHPLSYIFYFGKYFKARIFIEAAKDNVDLSNN